MPKKPRKIHFGGRLWSDQKTRDAAAWAAQKAASEPKPKTVEEKREEAEARRRAAEARWRSEERQRQQAEEGARRRAAGGGSDGSGGSGQRRQERQGQTKAPVRPGRLAHLRVLGLTAAQDNAASISKAYRTLAMKYHPDRNDSAAALAMMKLVNNANDFLTKD
jgi:DnaJ-domain-containing protein 1